MFLDPVKHPCSSAKTGSAQANSGLMFACGREELAGKGWLGSLIWRMVEGLQSSLLRELTKALRRCWGEEWFHGIVGLNLAVIIGGCSGAPQLQPNTHSPASAATVVANPAPKNAVLVPNTAPSSKSKKAIGSMPALGKGGGYRKIGKPYLINGVRYVPRHDPDYEETGIASWYGHGFHGKKTANGEFYNMHGLTAAHRTLPLPSFVSVTNLQNGRKVKVRVNDRGPFKKGRVIDVSSQVAKELRFSEQGTAKVKVKYLGPAPLDSGDRRE